MSKHIDNSGPAFPAFGDPRVKAQTEACGRTYVPPQGMTLRDYFAAKAMQGICAHSDSWGLPTPDNIANAAYEMADAMIKAREA